MALSYFSTSPVADNTSATSIINPTALISAIQTAHPGDIYFDTTSELGPVYVYYTHTSGRQQKKVIHDLTRQAQVQWSNYAQDGTWEKTKIKAFDRDGASIILERSDIGASEDLTHSGGLIYLNT